MHHILKCASLTLVIVCGGWAASAAQAQPDLSVDARAAECPPRCSIAIEVPASEENSAEVDVETLTTRPGQEVTWQSDQPVLVVFPQQTPFVGPTGRPIYQFNVRGMQRLRVRNDSDEICSPPGCNYMVVDVESEHRPPVDPGLIIQPYIIIQR